MTATQKTEAKVSAVAKYREYYEVNKYLMGMVSINHVTCRDKLEDVVIVTVPKGCKVQIVEEGQL